MGASLEEEIKKRRTFAIISHPDAGKTTLTEKFLLYGGAINTAGSVKGKANSKYAVSDWMEIEKERGISVTSSVLQFNYDGYCINILDTPGHQDFSEDTYRTLMAADSAVMVIDASKGVEAQTIKLFKVCVMRHIPIFTFINKMDLEARDSFELLDEIENVLGIRTCPINWPIGAGKRFKGVYDRDTKKVSMFQAVSVGGAKSAAETDYDVTDPALKDAVGDELYAQLMDEIELLDGASDEFDQELVDKGLASYAEAGIKAHGYVCDVTDEDAVNAMVAKITEEVGHINILVNNAGIIKRIPMCEMTAAQFRQVIDVDLNAPFIVAKAIIPDMIEQGGGKIINICSMMSELGRETVSAYAAAKGGLKMLTKNIASEYGQYNIQCNGIGPGYIATPQTAPLREIQPDGSRHPFDQFIVAKTPAARWGNAEDLGGPAVFLASEASDFVNGLILYVDGGILAYIGKQPG